MVSSNEIEGNKIKARWRCRNAKLEPQLPYPKKIAKEEEEEVDQLVFDLNCESRT